MRSLKTHLSAEIFKCASLRGNEYAWHINDIPKVVEAARKVGMINIGGQLQFRLPENGTCECHWVEVNTYKLVPKHLPWDERVNRTAEAALSAFARLQSEFDFIEEGKRIFGEHLRRAEQKGVNLVNRIYFVWYALDREEAQKTEHK